MMVIQIERQIYIFNSKFYAFSRVFQVKRPQLIFNIDISSFSRIGCPILLLGILKFNSANVIHLSS